ncbi:MAG: tRNA lysidine(34) synthetase TilS [Oscillospiraceae bacterium]|nr:tRNA lysidine(34) synthetase TilS [Oscillospiraceae bacterium]
MIDKVKKAIGQYNMLEQNDSVTVALSGGADSVALLNILLALREDCNLSVSAVHVNHQLRGEESFRDEAFVRKLCEKLNIPVVIRSVDVMGDKKKHQSVEEAAREARYKVFSEMPGKTATAHTADDNAETVLLNLIRGTGLKGLCGIPPVREVIIRPLILCERSDIEEFCRSKGLLYVTDSTNFSEEFTRNKIRLSLIPLIKELNPSFAGCVTRTSEILREDCRFLEGLIKTDDKAGDYNIEYLRSLEKPLLNRIIIDLLSNNNVSPSKTRISNISEIIAAGRGKINVEKNKFAVIEGDFLRIITIIQNYR